MSVQWALTALFHFSQLLGHGLEVWELQLLVYFQHHLIDVLQHSALRVSTFLLSTEQNK